MAFPVTCTIMAALVAGAVQLLASPAWAGDFGWAVTEAPARFNRVLRSSGASMRLVEGACSTQVATACAHKFGTAGLVVSSVHGGATAKDITIVLGKGTEPGDFLLALAALAQVAEPDLPQGRHGGLLPAVNLALKNKGREQTVLGQTRFTAQHLDLAGFWVIAERP